MRLQRGVALIQVLFLTVILAVMLVAIHLKAKAAINLAQQLADRTAAELQLYSADNQLKLVLLSQQQTLTGSSDPQTGTTLAWNLYNEPFPFAGVTVQLQDISGLVSLYNGNAMAQLFDHVTDPKAAMQLSAALQDWQDSDDVATMNGAEQRQYPATVEVRNNLMQSMHELSLLKGMTSDVLAKLAPSITTAPQNYQNPLVMPASVLDAMLGSKASGALQQLRRAGAVDSQQVYQLLGKSVDDSWVYAPSGSYQVTFSSEFNNVKLSRQYVIRLSPYQEAPFTYWEYLNQYHAENH